MVKHSGSFIDRLASQEGGALHCIITIHNVVAVHCEFGRIYKQERAYHAHEAIAAKHRNKIEELDAKLLTMWEASSEGEGKDDQLEHRSKRRRE